MISKKKLLIIFLLIVGAIAVYWYTKSAYFGSSFNISNSHQMPGMPVDVVTATTESVSTKLEAIGSLLANESVVVAPEISSRVTAILFEEGKPVEKGTTLLELDTASFRAELNKAQADLKLAQENFQRSQTLAHRGIGTQVALDEAKAQLQSAQANVAVAQVNLDKAIIVAPFKGIAGLRSVSVGDYVSAGKPLFDFADIDPLKVEFHVPETSLEKIKVGQNIEVHVDALPNRTFQGEIYAIDPLVDPNGRSLTLRARIPNTDLALKPGLFARISIITDIRPQAVVIPETAIIPQGDDKYVYTVKDGKAHFVKVELGERMPGRVEIRQGLSAGDTVVTAGQIRLHEGAPVSIAPAQQGAKP